MKFMTGVLATMLIAGVAFAQPPAAPRRTAPLLSPQIAADRMVTFRVRAPQAQDVSVSGQFTKDKAAMTKDTEGVWSTTVGPVDPGVYEYGFTIDGFKSVDPSNSMIKPQRWPGSSILEVLGTPPLITEFQDVPHGGVTVLHYRSKALGGKVRRLHVYTPPDYDKKPGVRYPVLYLLHGHGDNDLAWSVHCRANFIVDNLLAQGKVKAMVIVMTDGHPIPPEGLPSAGGYGDNTAAYGKDLFEDVMPMIESRYRVKTDAASRALVGLSMGGHQALTLGLNHADRFAWVAGFSSSAPKDSEIATPLGDVKALNKKLKWLWIGCGKDDFLLKRNEELVALLKSKGVNRTWRLTDGGHSWPVWRRYLEETTPQLFAGNGKPAAHLK